MPFTFTELRIPGVVLVEPKVFRDERGHFLETFSQSAFQSAGLPTNFVQANHSRSIKHVLRGLHFQRPPKEQAKLVRAVTGKIFDVAVDLRPESATRGQWVGVELSGENHHQLFIPEGFAHGFCVLSEVAEVTYLVTDDYSPEHEAGVIWNDPELAISWPVSDPLVAKRDLQWPEFASAVSV